MISAGDTLLLDLGNTNLKWAWLGQGVAGSSRSVSHREGGIGQALSVHWADLPAPGRILAASVLAPEANQELSAWTRKQWGLEPQFLRAELEALGVRNGYDEPERLGVDRWLVLIAMHCLHPGAACVVDCGSAITLDVISAAGDHLGGLILPGLGLMREALRQRTAIPQWQDLPTTQLLATRTDAAIAAGGVNAVAALVVRVVAEAAGRLKETPVVVLTGGDAPQVQAVLTLPCTIEPDLVLQGLALIAGS
jgi:type III pantothenate kinase